MKSAAIYMRVNRNLDIRNQELEDFQRVCDQALSAHPDWCLKETYVDIVLRNFRNRNQIRAVDDHIVVAHLRFHL